MIWPPLGLPMPTPKPYAGTTLNPAPDPFALALVALVIGVVILAAALLAVFGALRLDAFLVSREDR